MLSYSILRHYTLDAITSRCNVSNRPTRNCTFCVIRIGAAKHLPGYLISKVVMLQVVVYQVVFRPAGYSVQTLIPSGRLLRPAAYFVRPPIPSRRLFRPATPIVQPYYV